MNTIQTCFSEQELAEKLGLSYWTVRQLRLQQGLPHFKCGRRVFYRLTAVETWFAQQEQGDPQPASSPIRAIK